MAGLALVWCATVTLAVRLHDGIPAVIGTRVAYPDSVDPTVGAHARSPMRISPVTRDARGGLHAGETDRPEAGPKVDMAIGAGARGVTGTAQEGYGMLSPQGVRRGAVHPPVGSVGITGMTGGAGDERRTARIIGAMAGVATIGRRRKSGRLLLHEFLTMEEHSVNVHRSRAGPTVGKIIGITTLARGGYRFRLLYHPCRRMGKLGVTALARDPTGAAQEVRSVTGLAGVAIRRLKRAWPMTGRRPIRGYGVGIIRMARAATDPRVSSRQIVSVTDLAGR